MWIFSVMAVLMLIGTAVCYFAMGYLPDMYIHVSAYGFILAGLGYIIELMKKREKNVEEHVEWIFEKKFKSFFEELKTIRTMILKLDERRDRAEFTPPPITYVKNEEKQIFSAPPPPPVPKSKLD
ncbi:MAG: hypothetical protein WCS96_07575 [Victivallales bacterium]|jgi:hypothetical protein